MIRILVISDTHKDMSWKKSVVLKHNDCDYFFHLGDSECYDESLSPFIGVKGNCDYFSNLPDSKIVHTKFGNIYLCHYPPFKSDINKMKDIRLFLHGHTHVHNAAEIYPGVYVANPGSYSRPRDGTKGTYLIIEMDEKAIHFQFEEVY